MAANDLTDSHVVFLSGKIASEDELVQLGVTGLKLQYSKIKTALTNHPKDITSAAHDVLHTWVKNQKDRTEALMNLNAALEACGLNLLVDDLKKFSAEPTETCKISPEKELTDPHVVFLSGKIASEDELVQLGVTGLKLPYSKIKTALTNHPKDITSAAHDVLRTWVNYQKDRTEALTNLNAALEACGLQIPLILFTRIEYLQELTKQSLRSKPFCLARGKDWTLKPSMIHLKEIYTDLSWTRKHRKAYEVEKEDLKNITQILNEEQLGEDGPVRILVQAGGGMGKSTAMKHLALCWADGTADELKDKFQFVFHIALKHVKSNITIEEIIIAQHNGLKANNVKPAEIKAILQGQTSSKVLLLVDGHDEYKCGINTHIDRAIEKESLWNCWMVVTSRETEQIKKLKQYMDAEAEIRGFDSKNIRNYITRSLGSNEKTNKLLEQATSRNIYRRWHYEGIMTIPFLLHMICVIFLCNFTLPKTKTGIMQAIVDRSINREAIRKKGRKAVKRAEAALFNLGKLAWQGLNEPGKKLIFEKEEVIRAAGKEALELGLLFGTERMSMQEEETDVLCFAHLLFQEFVAAIYISQQTKAEIKKLFPTWESIEQHKEVVRFACAIAENPDVLIDVICNRAATGITTKTSVRINLIWGRFPNCCDLLESTKQELVENTYSSMDPLKNSHLYVHEDGESTSSLVLSRVYLLKRARRAQDTENKYLAFRHDEKEFHGILYQIPNSGSSICSADTPVKYAIVVAGRRDDDGYAQITPFVKVLHEQHKIHVFSVDSSNISLRENESQSDSGNSLSVEYYLFLSNMDPTYNKRNLLPLYLLQEINSCQEVSINHLDMRSLLLHDEAESQLMMDVLRLSNNIKSVTIHGCHLPASVYQHIAQQLYRCHKSDKSKYGERKMSTEGAGEEVGLHMHMDNDDIRNLIQAKRLTRLRELDLLFSPVTDYLGDLLGAGFPSLEKLDLCNTKLSGTDVSKLAKVIRGEGLLKLKELDLAFNTLTGCLRDLLGVHEQPDCPGQLRNDPQHPGFPYLEDLKLLDTSLSRDDLLAFSTAVQRGRLPRLKQLNVRWNRLHKEMEAAKRLVQSCVDYYTESEVKLILDFFDNEIIARMRSICYNSKIIIKTD